MRQLVTESVLLALAAGALGLFVIWVLWTLFDSRIPDMQLILDWRGLLFTFGFAVATGILFGISPALHATRVPLSEVLKDTAGAVVAARSRLQAGLVVAQIAFTQPALLGMGALILEMTADLRELPAPIFADRILDGRFNTNPRYGSMDQNAKPRWSACRQPCGVAGVVAVVPQENADDYFDVSVHRRSRERVEFRRICSQAPAPAGYFSSWDTARPGT